MRNTLFIICFTLLFFGCKSNEQYFEDAICFTHINTIDAQDGLKENMTVIIKGDRIIKISPSDELILDKANTIIDAAGKYMMPGLWDTHVHFAYIEELAPSMFDLFLTHGVTSVRDTGGDLEFVKKWKGLSIENPTTAPRVMIAGPLIDGTPNVYDGSTPRRPELSVETASVEDITNLIEKLHAEGVDLLKAYEMLSPEQFNTLMTIAKQKNLEVTGHIPLSMDAISVSNTGINSIEHLRNLELSCAENAEELLAERRQMLLDSKGEEGMVLRTKIHKAQKTKAIQNQSEEKTNEVLDALLKNNTWQVPTMALNTVITRDHVTTEAWRETFKLLPDSLETQWLAGSKRIEAYEITNEMKLQSNWAKDMVKRINDKKIGIMAGTDCPIAYLTPGYSLHEELIILVESGLSPIEAIASATSKPAEYFSLEKELGYIKEGYLADLLILNKNPLNHIENTKTIDAIVKSGKYYSREQLNTLLESLKMHI